MTPIKYGDNNAMEFSCSQDLSPQADQRGATERNGPIMTDIL